MNAMHTQTSDCGFNFSCVHPHIWWTHFCHRKQHLKVDFLTFSTHPELIELKVSEDGKFPKVIWNVLRYMFTKTGALAMPAANGSDISIELDAGGPINGAKRWVSLTEWLASCREPEPEPEPEGAP